MKTKKWGGYNYQSPEVSPLEVDVEAGFAASGSSYSGTISNVTLLEDDYWDF